MIDITYKTVKPSHLKKLQIIRNIINVIFQVIFISSLNFDKANQSFLNRFLNETYFRKNAA